MDTTALALPKGRRVGQPGHDIARQYLVERLAELKIAPWKGEDYAITYDRPLPNTRAMQRFTNLIGVIPGADRSLAPILLGAHYDSVIDAPCADDNATSVALNLAIAEEFQPGELERDLVIAFFDAEEPPHFLGPTMGSRRFVEDHCQGIDFAGVIVSDLIGHDLKLADLGVKVPGGDFILPHTRKTLFVMGAESDSILPPIVEEVAGQIDGLYVFPTLSRYIGAPSDHHAFEKAGHPTLFLSCAQGRYYHDVRDDLKWINFEKLAQITEFTEGCIRGIDAKAERQRKGTCDPFDFELRMIQKAVGPVLPVILKSFGITIPQSRADLDKMIGMMV